MRETRMFTLGICAVLVISASCSKSATGPATLAGTWNVMAALNNNLTFQPQPLALSITAQTTGGATYGATWSVIQVWSGPALVASFEDSTSHGASFSIAGDSLHLLASGHNSVTAFCGLTLSGTIREGSASGVVGAVGSTCAGSFAGTWTATKQ